MVYSFHPPCAARVLRHARLCVRPACPYELELDANPEPAGARVPFSPAMPLRPLVSLCLAIVRIESIPNPRRHLVPDATIPRTKTDKEDRPMRKILFPGFPSAPLRPMLPALPKPVEPAGGTMASVRSARVVLPGLHPI